MVFVAVVGDTNQSEVWAELCQEARMRQEFILQRVGQRAELRVEVIMKQDDPIHNAKLCTEMHMSSSASAPGARLS